MTAPLTVLIVDDSPFDRHLVGGLIEAIPGWQASYAENGADALAAIARALPTVVLTDLVMPQIDGLKLVEQIRKRHLCLPVVVMTAHGSEEVAIRALRSGAASYIAKRQLARDLAETLQQLAATAQTCRSHRRLLECLCRSEAEFMLENDPALLPPLTNLLQGQLLDLGLGDETDSIRTGIALNEALSNALFHGNLEVSSTLRQLDADPYYRLAAERRRQAPYCERHLHLTARLTPAEAHYVIRDEGPGFNPTSLPDPTDPANLENFSGRGLLLIRTFMDEVRHNAAGNEITLIKRRRPNPST